MTFDTNKIAIIVPLYNDAENIERAVLSAVSQDVPAGYSIEIHIVDDCSTDDGPAVARRLADAHDQVFFLQQDVNMGPSAARNLALEKTDAAWFTPLDSDDIIEPQRIARLLEIALREEMDLVADNLLISMESTPDKAERPLWPGKPEGVVALTASLFVERSFDVEIPRSELGYLKPLINRASTHLGARPYIDALRFGEDFELYTRILLNGAKACLVDPLGYYLVCREGSASHTQSGRDHERLACISRQMLKHPGITPGARSALRRHAIYSEKEAAWWRMIDAVKQRKLGLMLSAFAFSPAASLHVIGNLGKEVIRRSKPA
ncbi:glycosyltransferase family 2 protein [Hyphomonas pacifica]|uniref:glycosyltransferase family 2 protein n=1 Tax=Hyphomonas pacifica TaxID=1280941 RepID=UPI000DBF9710|nr:glycosyltransferase family 2 protein [Hyphomonas pacifica]RAN35956.1 hypothetical protein HY11_12735 [Hyphomonas pacifica]